MSEPTCHKVQRRARARAVRWIREHRPDLWRQFVDHEWAIEDGRVPA